MLYCFKLARSFTAATGIGHCSIAKQMVDTWHHRQQRNPQAVGWPAGQWPAQLCLGAFLLWPAARIAPILYPFLIYVLASASLSDSVIKRV
jgi:hypothetical protein